jgi:hypothetical protein
LLLLRDLIIFVVLYPRDKFKKSLVGIENDTLPMELVVDQWSWLLILETNINLK